MSDEEIDIILRPDAQVAARCIILASMLHRIAIEEFAGEAEGDLAAEAFDLRAWLHTEGIWDTLTPRETAFLSAAVGTIAPADLVAASWQGAALDALAWALRLLPNLDSAELGDTRQLIEEIPRPWQKTGQWITSRELRPEPEIARQREIAEIWEWRVATEIPRRQATGRELAAIEEAIASTTREGEAAGLLAPGMSGGFRLSGNDSITRVGGDELDRLAAITTERLLALNWLCGFGDNWDAVPLDV
jgi:hypothetical protein